MPAKKDKLGRNPFEKKGSRQVGSRVGRLIEAQFSLSEASPQVPQRGLVERVQEMKISVNLAELFKKKLRPDFL